MDAIRRHVEQAVDAVARRAGLHVRRLSRQPEHNLLGLRDQPIRTIIDVGANTGQFARKARRIFPEASLFCFEPLPTPFARLDAWAQQQHGRVTCIQSAVGAETGSVMIIEHVDHSPSSSVMESTTHQLKISPASSYQIAHSVPLVYLDNYFHDIDDLKLPALIKIDVQGYEMNVLAGALKLLAISEFVMIEISLQPLYVKQPTALELISMLNSHGHEFVGIISQVLDSENKPLYIDALFQRSDR